MVGITLIITLLPFRFARPDAWRIMWEGTTLDVVANVLLFLPLGFLYRLATRHHRRHSVLRVLWVGAVISATIEVTQLFEVERYSSLYDVLANAAGAWLGAAAADWASGRLGRDEEVVGRLSLELPLMGLVYLMIPLLWLNALANGGDDQHALLSLLIAVFGGSVVGGLQRNHFGPDRQLPLRTAVGGAGIWYLAGSFPLLASKPLFVAAGVVTASALAWWRGSRGSEPRPDRRYEIAVLVTALPAFVAYLLMLAGGPLASGMGPWRGDLGFPGVASEWSRVEILRLLELVAAFTLAGYAVAEHRGRVETRFRTALLRLSVALGGGALMIELLRGFEPELGASAARMLLVFGAGLYGAWLYHLQRRHILLLISRSRPAAARVTNLPSGNVAA